MRALHSNLIVLHSTRRNPSTQPTTSRSPTNTRYRYRTGPENRRGTDLRTRMDTSSPLQTHDIGPNLRTEEAPTLERGWTRLCLYRRTQ